MKIRCIKIERFRGIKSLEWKVTGDLVCLVGPGDSTKSTILDAIELALSPKYSINFDDTDFYQADVNDDNPIRIVVTVGDLPENFIKDNKFGLEIRGYSSEGELHDEPGEYDDKVISIQVTVDSSYEPQWKVINTRNPDGKRIETRDRSDLGMARLGDDVDRHLGWNRWSILNKLTENSDKPRRLLVEAGRKACRNIGEEDLPSYNLAAKKAQEAAAKLGVKPTECFRPGLDIHYLTITDGGITLHDGSVPLRRYGLGTRRLLALALQREVSKEGGIILLDEVEHGLEPHRIRRFIQALKSPDSKDIEAEGGKATIKQGQAFLTTHSTVVLEELKAYEIKIVRCSGGEVKIIDVPDDLQNIVRGTPEAFLGKKILVCEGKTELGVCWALDEWWSSQKALRPFAYLGVIPTLGNGTESSGRALKFKELGYDVALLCDSDKPLDPPSSEVQGNGVRVIEWEGKVSIEERICLDLPLPGVIEIVKLAVKLRALESVRDAIACKLGITGSALGNEIDSWHLSQSENELKKAIGSAAKTQSWFKRPDLGKELGQIINKYLDVKSGSDFETKIKIIREWADSDD